jgi:predicted PhzF superfamily epimerase YddE/YHI9
MRPFAQVDVFTREPYLGNPVAVVLDADGLTDARMQQVAAWTNLSETTFVLPPRDAAADYRVRIFTPSLELPFAGHPTLGTCHAWLAAGGVPRGGHPGGGNSGGGHSGGGQPGGGHSGGGHSGGGQPGGPIVQECAAGLVRIRQDQGMLAFAAPPVLRDGPVDEPLAQRIAAGLGIDRAAIVDLRWADNGPGWIAVLLDSAEAVLAVRPGDLGELDVGIAGPWPAGSPEALEVRAFFSKDGQTAEDPVTGSLNASLAQWLIAAGRVSAPYVASQGTALGRRGRVHVSADDAGQVWVGGGTVTCVTGSVAL